MTANELANLLEVDSWYKLITREEIATMLRQQQAEIESLKAEKEALKVRSWEGDSLISKLSEEIEELKILFDKTMNNWAKDMERKK